MTFVATDIIDDIGRLVGIGQQTGLIPTAGTPTGPTSIPPSATGPTGGRGIAGILPGTLNPGGCNCGEGAVCAGECRRSLFPPFDFQCSQCVPARGGTVQIGGTTATGSFQPPTPVDQGKPISGGNGCGCAGACGCKKGSTTSCTLKNGRSGRTNKTGYYVHERGNPTAVAYVPPNTRCVKSRSTNFGNMKAAQRAARRIDGALRHMRRLEKTVKSTLKPGRR